MSRRAQIVSLLLFGSGCCALVYQLAWTRELRLIFGATHQASAAVLAIFMGGLGLGNAVLGPLADRRRSPLAYYAALEFLIALLALASPALIDYVRSLYIGWGGQPVLGPNGATLARLGLAALVLLGPTFLMGGTLPAAARSVVRDDDLARHDVGWLYGINTLGATCGALVSTFLLLEWLGTRNTLYTACALNFLVAVAAWGLSFRFAREPATGAAPPASDSGDELDPDATPAAAQPRIVVEMDDEPALPSFVVYLSAAIVGFAFLLMELIWYRMLGPLLGGATFTFGLILAIALAGIGVGGALYGRLFRRGPTARAFALTCGLEALALAVPYALGDRLAEFALHLQYAANVGLAAAVFQWTVVTGIVVLPAAIVSGVQFPLLIALLGTGQRNIARQVGWAFGFNTLGAIAGSLAGGFGLITQLGALGAWKLTTAILAVLGVAVLFLTPPSRRTRTPMFAPALAAGLAILCLFATGPTAVWRHSPIGARRVPEPAGKNGWILWENEYRRSIADEWDGVESSVALDTKESYAFITNGKSDGSAIGDASAFLGLGLVGGILHPAPKTALVVGLGTGESAGWLAQLPTIERVDVIELEPVIRKVAEACSLVNYDLLDNPKINLIYNDAREEILASRAEYDLILSQPSNPYRAGVASLYTAEFYRAVHARLKPGGILIQWLQAYEIDDESVGTALHTLLGEFSEVQAWQSDSTNFLLACSSGPIPIRGDELRAHCAVEPYRSGLLHAFNTVSVEGLLARYVAPTATVREAARQLAPEIINTDDRNRLEYGAARGLGGQQPYRIHRMRELSASRGELHPQVTGGDIDWELVGEEFLSFHCAEGDMDRNIPMVESLTPHQQVRVKTLRAVYLSLNRHATFGLSSGELRAALVIWGNQPDPPRTAVEIFALAYVNAQYGETAAPSLIEQLRAIRPAGAEGLAALYAYRTGKIDEAAESLIRTFGMMRSDPWYPEFGFVLELAAEIAHVRPQLAPRLLAAIDEPFAASQFNESRLKFRCLLGARIGAVEAAREIERLEPHVPWQREFLELRRQTYKSLDHPLAAQAEADHRLFERYNEQQQVQRRK